MRSILIFLVAALLSSGIFLLIMSLIFHLTLKEGLASAIAAGVGGGLGLMLLDMKKRKQDAGA